MATNPAELKARVLAFLRGRRTPLSVLEDEDGRSATLLDAPAGKSLRLRWDQLAQVEERSTRDHPEPYLLLLFEDGRQVALADVGFAFAPALHNSGPLPELPRTFCFRDFGVLASGIEQLLAQEGRGAEAARAILAAIALVDGARAAGFVVSGEERALEELLHKLEERGGPGAA
jgi:hypothetical protein